MNRDYARLLSLAARFSGPARVQPRGGRPPLLGAGVAAAAAHSGGAPIVTIDGGAVRGVAVPGGYAFRGLPYAAPPTGRLRWRAPQPPAEWHGVRDATVFAPSCPQPPGSFTIGPQDEDCLYLNVSTPQLNDHRRNGSAGARVDPRRRLHQWRRPGLRPHQAGGRGHRRRHHQLPARRARLPGASRAGVAARRPVRQLRADGPAGGLALGAAQHRPVRRRPGQRHHRGRVGRWPVSSRAPRLPQFPRAVPPGHRARADPSR